ncbi:MAG: hypothetical protein WCA39_03930, partial [Nitrososphaeraceae archaeon]
ICNVGIKNFIYVKTMNLCLCSFPVHVNLSPPQDFSFVVRSLHGRVDSCSVFTPLSRRLLIELTMLSQT